MTAHPSLRRESIQRSSHASEAMSRQSAESVEALGPRHALEHQPITLTTTVTLTAARV